MSEKHEKRKEYPKPSIRDDRLIDVHGITTSACFASDLGR